MATVLKTPGVYIEEIPKLPPSIAQVETAIPAFIGYTEKAKKKIDDDLVMEPLRLSSLKEYQTYFGYSEKETSIGVQVLNADLPNEEVIVTQPSNPSPFKMYYNMQMYFANGGGPCFIVSVGTYASARTNNSVAPVILNEQAGFMGLNDGLNAIALKDEPTLLVFPDASALTDDAEFYGLYNSALTQCNKLQDRFTLLDTYSDKEYNNGVADVDPVEEIRSNISPEKDMLKYGATYYPYLETTLDYAYSEGETEVNGLNISLSATAQKVVDGIDLLELETLLTAIVDTKLEIEAASESDALLSKNTIINQVNALIGYLESNKNSINNLIEEATESEEPTLVEPAATSLVANMTTWMDANLEQIIADLYGKLYKLNQDDTKAKLVGTLTTNATNIYGVLGINEGTITDSTIHDSLEAQKTTATNELFDLKAAIDALGITTLPKLSDIKATNNALYNQIKSEISRLNVTLTPSSTIAGIYARVDGSRGVWKAPANVGFNYVVKPSVFVSHEDQMGLNVDTLAGKSINAIRSFTGRGTVVWGARTLAGNDNEWRYVSVRRFFNMVEQSCKNATEPFVFEPNDANTWLKVQTMIENYLTNLWREGALQGEKPEHAFYVAVGLGKTMSALDILEGRMIVEIGMAVVRPAEFIILEFSHKLAES
ncbi:phage tail protein [Maribacter algarum]|uniref:Phage tail protein n=1 Tax=Maribacter algarum (ex Zhang et al. 2020) TaxID=2578118 RepID=A0A5S3PSQ2_9FLAO|nr:phage tail sheath C-terminal domain-containing protein [Maribacter algarum]TMM58019.1 phage tail protein [Maribacter algarum]